MFWIITVLLAGINLAPFLFFKLDIWHAQGFWVQIMTLGLFSWMFIEKPKETFVRNVWFGLLILWAGINTSVVCFIGQTQNRYDISHFFPFFNFLCIGILYYSIVQFLNKNHILKIINVLRWTIVITLLTCTIQLFGYAQFFAMLHPFYEDGKPNLFFNNSVVGFIGQPTHLAGLLGMCSPLLLYRKSREDYLALALMFIILLFFTGTTKGDIAISGLFVFIPTVLFYLFFTDKKLCLIFAGFLIMGCVGTYFLNGFGQHAFDDKGRFDVWKFYFGLLKQMPITGAGLGTVNILHLQTPYPKARHLHLEFLQLWIELGLVALILLGGMIKAFFTMKIENKESIALKSIILGFLISCCFNYPAHLWLSACYALFAYAGTFVFKDEEIWASQPMNKFVSKY